MTERCVIWGRAVGIALSWAFAFLVAAAVQFTSVLWNTGKFVWRDRPDPRTPQQIMADEEKEKRRHEADEAANRRRKRERLEREDGYIVGAIKEYFNDADEGE